MEMEADWSRSGRKVEVEVEVEIESRSKVAE